MKKLEHDTFLEALTELFRNQRKHGTVVLTMKRYDGRTKPVPKDKNTPPPNPSEYLCLIRAHITGSGNKKNKISTIVHQKDAVKFQMAYCSLLRSNIDGLKKSNKKARKTKG